MQISGANYGMPEVPLEDVLAFHRELGLRAIEITVLPRYTTSIERQDREEVRRWRELLRQHEMEVSAVAIFENLGDTDEEAVAARLARHRRTIDLAVDLAAGDRPPFVACMPGGAVGTWEQVKERLAERIAGLAEYARQRGVVLAMKAHAITATDYPHKLIWLFEQVGSPSFRFCFDYSHFEVLGLSIEQAMLPLLNLSPYIEAKATRGRSPDHEYMIPGEGVSDFVAQFRLMKALRYDGYVTPEISVHVQRRPNYDPYAALRLAVETLRNALGVVEGTPA